MIHLENRPFTEASINGMLMRLGVKPENKASRQKISRVLYKPPVTVIFWADGKKTVVKCSQDDNYDPLTGFLMAVCKRTFGNGGSYNNVLREFVPGYGE